MSATFRREIFGQPALLTELLPALRATVDGLARPAGRVFAGGCGDGFFAAGAAAGLFAQGRIDYRPASAHDLAFHVPLGPGDTVVLASVSGGTRRTVQAARRARDLGARTIAVTCDGGSPLATSCDDRLVLPFQPLDRRLPHTADYLATLLALAVLAEAAAGRPDADLDNLPAVLAQVLQESADAALAAGGALDPSAKLFVLGQGANQATAQYIAAKFHESGGLTALWNETENFVHGMNFMVDPEDLVVVIGGDGPGAFRAEELLVGLKRLCQHVVAIGVDPATAPVGSIGLPPMQPSLNVFAAAVIGQLLCLGLVEAKGMAVDQPRAGRVAALTHAEVQRAWMTQTDTAI